MDSTGSSTTAKMMRWTRWTRTPWTIAMRMGAHAITARRRRRTVVASFAMRRAQVAYTRWLVTEDPMYVAGAIPGSCSSKPHPTQCDFNFHLEGLGSVFPQQDCNWVPSFPNRVAIWSTVLGPLSTWVHSFPERVAIGFILSPDRLGFILSPTGYMALPGPLRRPLPRRPRQAVPLPMQSFRSHLKKVRAVCAGAGEEGHEHSRVETLPR